MGSDLDAGFEKLEKLLGMVPLTTLRCPYCNYSDGENFHLLYQVCFSCPVGWDGPSKLMEVDYTFEQFFELIGTPEVFCDACAQSFPIPEGWNFYQRQTAKRYDRPQPTKKEI